MKNNIRQLLLSIGFGGDFPFDFEGVKASVTQQGRPMMLVVESQIIWIMSDDSMKLGKEDFSFPEQFEPNITDNDLLEKIYSRVEKAVERFKSFPLRKDFILASNCGDEKLVRELFERAKLNPSEINNALLNAARDKKKDLVLFLQERGGDINAQRDHVERCALHEAVSNKSAEMVEFLLNHGASPNICDFNKDYPLHLAIRIMRESEIGCKICDILCDHGARTDLSNNSNETPLLLAQNLPRVQEILLKHHQRKHPEIEGPSGAEATIGGCELIQPSSSTKATSSQGLSKSNSKQGRAAASSFPS